jgi:3-methyladenine DNA glycosylase AlkD
MYKIIMQKLKQLKNELNKFADKDKGEFLKRFFKTGPGQYGAGDIFLGINVPTQRSLANNFSALSLKEIQELLDSKIHEYRLVALLIMVKQYQKAGETEKKSLVAFYLKNSQKINNWDLVDLSSPNILGNYLLDKPRDILYKLAKSNNLWQKRIAIISTLAFIRNKNFSDTIKISEILLHDSHDLIHKAVGWMLREAGKREIKVLKSFLDKYHKIMPRTMLRYAIEKLSEEERRFYLGKTKI